MPCGILEEGEEKVAQIIKSKKRVSQYQSCGKSSLLTKSFIDVRSTGSDPAKS